MSASSGVAVPQKPPLLLKNSIFRNSVPLSVAVETFVTGSQAPASVRAFPGTLAVRSTERGERPLRSAGLMEPRVGRGFTAFAPGIRVRAFWRAGCPLRL